MDSEPELFMSVRWKKVAAGDRLKTDATSAHCSAAAAAASLRLWLLSALNLSDTGQSPVSYNSVK